MIDTTPDRFEAAPLPSGVLPEPLCSFVRDGARAIGCDAAMIALPAFAALGSAIGTSRRVRLKRTWAEYPIFWTAVVSPSGTQKSPASKLAVQFLQAIQDRAFDRHAQAVDKHREEQVKYERELADWKRSKAKRLEDPPEKPPEPVAERHIVSDCTVEALAAVLQDQPRGVCLIRDELSAWLGSFDAYKSARGADAGQWLELWQAGTITVDRKTGPHRVIHVPRAAVSVCGSIQPEIFRDALGRQHFADGLAARLIVSMPQRRAKHWTEAELHPDLEDATEALYGRLLALQFNRDDQGRPVPVDVPLTHKGKVVWLKWYEQQAQRQSVLSGDLAAIASKIEAYCARFALLFHLIRMVERDDTLEDPNAIDAESMAAGMAMALWAQSEWQRVYGALHEPDEDRATRELVELIRARGGSITVREHSRSSRYVTASIARDELRALADAGFGALKPVTPTGREGGRPSEVFTLAAQYLNGAPAETIVA